MFYLPIYGLWFLVAVVVLMVFVAIVRGEKT